jgi:hypothetical protein
MADMVLGPYALALLRRAKDAQRHHRLYFSFRARPTLDLRSALRMLTRVGVAAHYTGRKASGRAGMWDVQVTLRYWEGSPLVGVISTPMRRCTYAELARHSRSAQGAALLVWAEGRLTTGAKCLQRRTGGLLVAVLSG